MIEDDILRDYKCTQSMKRTAANLSVSEAVVRKVLVQSGVIDTPLTRRICALRKQGLSQNEIAELLGVSSSCVSANAPYIRGGSYKNKQKSDNASKVARCRERQAEGAARKYNNITGVKGVLRTRHGTFCVTIGSDGKRIHLGTYATLEEAISVRRGAEKLKEEGKI